MLRCFARVVCSVLTEQTENAKISAFFKKGGNSFISTDDSLIHFAEEFGLFYEQYGLPRTSGRILGWLLICDPPQQTMNDLVEALKVSKSSISTASRLLIQAQLIDRISIPGQRRDYYRLSDDAWIHALETRIKATEQTRKLVARGLDLLGEESVERKERLQEMHDFFVFMEETFPVMIADWQARRRQPAVD